MSNKLSKRKKLFKTKVDSLKVYKFDEAVKILKEVSKDLNTKFDESMDVSVNLGIDTRKSDQNVRGSVVLPHGTGKTVRVAVFAQGENADKAKAAGADIVGFEDLAAEVKKGNMDFDIVIATPDAMRVVGQLGQILGPRGLMPNPKVGTVTADVETAVNNAKSGQVQYRAEKGGIVHCTFGKTSFSDEHLKDNLVSLIAALKKAKPSSSKGTYIQKVSVSTTMGPGISLEKGSVE